MKTISLSEVKKTFQCSKRIILSLFLFLTEHSASHDNNKFLRRAGLWHRHCRHRRRSGLRKMAGKYLL